jgi:diaminopimelate decarboxylase
VKTGFFKKKLESFFLANYCAIMLKYNNENKLIFSSQSKNILDCTEDYQGPLYVYDKESLNERAHFLSQILKPIEIFYAIKANSFAPLLHTFAGNGLGLDVVSLGEIEWGMEQGFKPQQMIFSGVGKTEKEISLALRWNIRQINVESIPELIRIAKIAQELRLKAPIALRVNPDVDAETHPYIATGLKNNKFGIATDMLSECEMILKENPQSLHFLGFSLHIGSQILELRPVEEALKKLATVIKDWQTRGWIFENLDAGGGLGVFYNHWDIKKEKELAVQWKNLIIQEWSGLAKNYFVEPGRWLTAHSGILLTKIEYVKKTTHHDFIIVDTGMHHLMRPALYQAQHRVMPLINYESSRAKKKYQIVGPICESSDVVRNEIELPEVFEGEYLAILDAGAYGETMSSDYNKRGSPKEIWF